MPMLIDAMTLVDTDTAETLQLFPAVSAISVVDFDPGFPAVRSVRVPNPGANGETDYTTLHGAKVVALTLRTNPDLGLVNPALASIRSWASPARNVVLVYTPTGMAERIVYLKGDQLGAPLPLDSMLFGVVDILVQWACPRGVELSSLLTQTVVPLQSSTTGGRVYPLVFPRTYTAQVGSGTAVVVNAGKVDSAPIIRMYGPVTGGRISNDTDGGKALEFLGYSLSSTEYVEIDMAAKTVQYQGLPGAAYNVRSKLTTRNWWTLKPGNNTIRFSATSGTSPAQLLVMSRDAWI
jgi:hypothetical protein